MPQDNPPTDQPTNLDHAPPSRRSDQRSAAKASPPTQSIDSARTAALAQPTRKAQINAYASTGPIPPLPLGQSFIDNIETINAAISLILQGAPPRLFDWTDPPTEKSLRHNLPARVRAVWDAVRPPERTR